MTWVPLTNSTVLKPSSVASLAVTKPKMSRVTLFLLLKSKYRRKWPLLGQINFITFSVIFSLLFVPARTSIQELDLCKQNCINGDCIVTSTDEGDTSRCDCWEGWMGQRCELCGGKVRLTDKGPRSWIAESHGNYTFNMKCSWLVEAETPNSSIRLHLNVNIFFIYFSSYIF